MKKNPTEENEERLPNENPSKTNSGADGRALLKFVFYVLIIVIVILILYLVKRYNQTTFNIFK